MVPKIRASTVGSNGGGEGAEEERRMRRRRRADTGGREISGGVGFETRGKQYFFQRWGSRAHRIYLLRSIRGHELEARGVYAHKLKRLNIWQTSECTCREYKVPARTACPQVQSRHTLGNRAHVQKKTGPGFECDGEYWMYRDHSIVNYK